MGGRGDLVLAARTSGPGARRQGAPAAAGPLAIRSAADIAGLGRSTAKPHSFQGPGIVLFRYSPAQFCRRNSGTRENSRVLLVTRMVLDASAWAAIMVSSAPMGWPRRSSSARNSP